MKPEAGTTQNAGWSARCHTLPHIFGHVPTTGPYNCFIYTILQCDSYGYKSTHLHIHKDEGGVALQPHQFRGPPPLSPMRVPQRQSLVMTPAPVGSNAQGSILQLWCWSPTMVHQK